jgi:phage-related protein
VLSSQFNNGYSQRLAVGINNVAGSWSVSFTGNQAYVEPIRDFLKRHKGAQHFLWAPPMEEQGAYITSGAWHLQSLGKNLFTLSSTFQQVFNP